MGRGESFGEHSALNDLPNPFSVEVFTPRVEIYKILRAHFIKYFGGLQGEPVERLRAQIVLKRNWLQSKIDLIKRLSPDQIIHSIEYKNESEVQNIKPSKENIKEVPYVKNNPKEKEVNPDAAAAG